MANKDFERMIKLGEWLEKCLTPDVKPWQVNNLFNEGLQLIGIFHQKAYPSKTIENMELNPGDTIYSHAQLFLPKIQEYQALEDRVLDFRGSPKPTTEELSQHVSNSLKKIEALEKYSEKNPKAIENRETYLFLLQIRGVNSLLKELSKSQFPWQKAIPMLNQKKLFHSTVHNLKTNFQSVTQSLIEQDGEMTRSRAISSGIDIKSEPEWGYNIILSNIFFDFLFLGGQEYFLFCKHCDKFTVIRRKGRKKFCSDICRTNYRRANNPAKI